MRQKSGTPNRSEQVVKDIRGARRKQYSVEDKIRIVLDAKIGFSSFNARADSVDTKPAFKGAWAKGRRCLVVTNGFYEWKKLDPEGKQKQPYAVSLGNRGPMLMAGLWDPGNRPMAGYGPARS